MNGQYSIKGYLLQSLVALLDSFETEWETICVEPNDESEKVDIKWTFKNNTTKAVQVKSSKNLITLSLAKKWAAELENSTPNAVHELVLVGDNIDNKINNKIGNVSVIKKSLSIDDFENVVLSKINSFYETNGRSIVAPSLGKLFVRSLNQQILENSVLGKVVSRNEFNDELLNSLQSVENHLKKSAYRLLLPSDSNISPNEDVKTTIINHFTSLIGWNYLNKNETRSFYDEKLGENKQIQIDYWGDYECPLKDKKRDIIYINADLVAEYPTDYLSTIKQDSFNVDFIRNSLVEENKIEIDNSIEHCVQFLLSLNETEKGLPLPNIKDAFKERLLNKNIVYYLIDNKKADFIISSIITARNYRFDDNLVVKFLYPITEDNSQHNKIGKRDTYLPPQYLSSSILPIIKEDKNKISVLMFCSDPFSKDRLKKVLWMLIRLTSGLANEYKVYFPDYDVQHENSASEALRSFKNNDLTSKVSVEKLTLCDSIDLQIVPSNINEDFKDETFDESVNAARKLKIETHHLIDYLPYGDMLKPFLASDAIKSEFLKMFLQEKRIFFRTADKTKIIQLMTSMLFSPIDIESLVAYAELKDKPLEANTVQYPVVDCNSNISESLSNVSINQKVIEEGLKANILSFNVTKPTNNNEEIVINVCVEQINPNKQALVNKVMSTAQVTVKKDRTTNNLEIIKEHNSKPARIAAERIAKQVSEQLIQRNIIEDQSIEIRFSDFTNKNRINFLLSFTNIDSSNIFTGFNAKSFKYMFDESAVLPEEYADKKGKECVLELRGRNLDQIRELQNETLKEVLLCESMSINYRFKYRDISGNYYVVLSFSNALNNRPVPDGLFNVKYCKLYIDNKCKGKLDNCGLQSIEVELKKHFNLFKREKLSQFNLI